MIPCQGCGEETENRLCCPKCSSLGRASYFCSQACFKKNWASHNRLHAMMIHNRIGFDLTKDSIFSNSLLTSEMADASDAFPSTESIGVDLHTTSQGLDSPTFGKDKVKEHPQAEVTNDISSNYLSCNNETAQSNPASNFSSAVPSEVLSFSDGIASDSFPEEKVVGSHQKGKQCDSASATSNSIITENPTHTPNTSESHIRSISIEQFRSQSPRYSSSNYSASTFHHPTAGSCKDTHMPSIEQFHVTSPFDKNHFEAKDKREERAPTEASFFQTKYQSVRSIPNANFYTEQDHNKSYSSEGHKLNKICGFLAFFFVAIDGGMKLSIRSLKFGYRFARPFIPVTINNQCRNLRNVLRSSYHKGRIALFVLCIVGLLYTAWLSAVSPHDADLNSLSERHHRLVNFQSLGSELPLKSNSKGFKFRNKLVTKEVQTSPHQEADIQSLNNAVIENTDLTTHKHMKGIGVASLEEPDDDHRRVNQIQEGHHVAAFKEDRTLEKDFSTRQDLDRSNEKNQLDDAMKVDKDTLESLKRKVSELEKRLERGQFDRGQANLEVHQHLNELQQQQQQPTSSPVTDIEGTTTSHYRNNKTTSENVELMNKKMKQKENRKIVDDSTLVVGKVKTNNNDLQESFLNIGMTKDSQKHKLPEETESHDRIIHKEGNSTYPSSQREVEKSRAKKAQSGQEKRKTTSSIRRDTFSKVIPSIFDDVPDIMNEHRHGVVPVNAAHI